MYNLKTTLTKHKFRETYLTPKCEREYVGLKRDKYMDRYLLTLSAPPGQGHKSEEWFSKCWRETIRAWEVAHQRRIKGWMLVMSRGHRGRDRIHAHIVWKGPRAPKDFGFLMSHWKNNFGTVMPKTVEEARNNKNGLRYWVKNFNELGAVVEVG